MKRKIWKIKEVTPSAVTLGQKYKIPTHLVQVLLNRNIPEGDFYSFLNHDITCLHSCFLLPDMEKAVCRIREAVSRKEKILIVGDYDVDGITSLAIFNEFIKGFSDSFSFYIPHRVKEGYGLNNEVIKKAKDENRTLIIAFDCGTNSIEEVALARSFGIDMIVVDHHHPKENLNNPFAFINPKRKDSKYPFCDLSAAALSFKLLEALIGKDAFSTLDLVALSLVCDVVPLKGENRTLLKEGLCLLKTNNRPAISALCKIAKIRKENITAFHIGYILGPRINASGRVASASVSLQMFLSNDEKEVVAIASKLQEYNQLRKGIELNILKEAEQKIENNLSGDYAIVVDGEGWHSGVLGIVASRLADKYYRPSFVISFEDGLGKGSARSIHSVHLMEALEKCSKSLCAYGGHKRAAGLEIFKEGLDEFRKNINDYIKENTQAEDLIPVLDLDLKLNFDDINIEFIEALDSLEPFGEENPKAMFASFGVSKKNSAKKINSGYSVWLSDGNKTFEGMVYDGGLLDILEYADKFDIAYTLQKNTYHNEPVLAIRDVAFSADKV
ncbi:MAG: single-stranded-DNA-specific exonuclease RecJ [Candidatus Omnitrophota bacterium]|jgi:single-stranded-DNA-specific exonuclease